VYTLKDQDGQFDVKMTSSKTKLAPLKIRILPKWELDAAKVGIQIADCIIEPVGKAVQLHTLYWFDSMVAIGWIKADSH